MLSRRLNTSLQIKSDKRKREQINGNPSRNNSRDLAMGWVYDHDAAAALLLLGEKDLFFFFCDAIDEVPLLLDLA